MSRWSAACSKAWNCCRACRAAAARWAFTPRAKQPLPIKSIRVAADVPAAERTNLEVMRTDTPAFAASIESRRNRPEEFFKVPAGRIDLCNVPHAGARRVPAHSP